MRHAIRLSLLAGISAALFACGPGAKLGGGKEGAASALFTAMGPTKASGSALSLAGQGIDAHANVTASCAHGGSVELSGFGIATNITGTTTSVSTSYTVQYNGCGVTTWDNPNTPAVENDTVVLNGNITVTQDVNVATASGAVSQGIKGKINYNGAFDDYLDVDVSESVEWSKLDTSGGSVSVNLDGSVKTSTDTYTYAKESITVTGGVLIAAPTK